MKSIALLLLLATPAAAQSIDPIAYGQRFCELRAMSVDAPAARKAAVDYAYRPHRTEAGRQADVKTAAQYVMNNCRGLTE